ncbi:MAG: von Willebrand factor type A domain-containing protein [Planctomycetota bacterium]
MNCEQAETLLAAYVFGEVESPVADELREHVERCETCSAGLRDMRAAAGLLEEALAGAPAPALTAERQKKLDGLKWPKKRDWSWLRRPIHVFGPRAAIPAFWRPPLWRPLATVGAGLCVVALLAGMLLPALGTARQEARSVKSMSNLKQIGTATQLWLHKHGDQEAYPPSLESLAKDEIIQEEKVFLDPKLATKQKRGEFTSDYDSILDRAGGQLKESAVDPSTPLAWEKKPGSGGRNVVFFDGHVKHMPEERFQRLMKDTNARLALSGSAEPSAEIARADKGGPPAKSEHGELEIVLDESASMTREGNGTFALSTGTNWGDVAARNKAEVALNGPRAAGDSGAQTGSVPDGFAIITRGWRAEPGGRGSEQAGGVGYALALRKDAEKNGGALYRPKPAPEPEVRLSDERDRARENGRKAGEPHPVPAQQPLKPSGPEPKRPGDGKPEGSDTAREWRGKGIEPGLSAGEAAPARPEEVATAAAPKTAPPSPPKGEAEPKPDEAMKKAPAPEPVRPSGGGGGGDKNGPRYSIRRYGSDEIIADQYKDTLKLKVPDATLSKLEKSLKADNGKESATAQQAAAATYLDVTRGRATVGKLVDQANQAKEKEEGKPPSVRVNPFVLTKLDNKSTFALEADTGSYTVTRSYIRRGELPPKHVVRVEEFVNAFDYNYAGNMKNAFSIQTTCARSPFRDELFQLKIGVKAKRVGRDGQRRNNIVICLDTSSSMGTPERLPLAQKASRMLVDNLAPADQVTVVTYGTQARLALDATPVKGNRKKINDAITSLQTSGSTNAAQGLAVAYLQAHKTFRSGDNNIVVIISDGIANVGPDDAMDILRNVKNDRRQGISLTSVGVGTGQYNDRLMEQLADNGDGRYVFIDTEAEAERVFVDEIAKMQVVAKDAKIQVEFDPGVVRRYRLLGYENRDIADDKFRDDTVDAGEIGSGQSATALYELELLKAKGRIGVVRVRYKDIATGKIEEIESEIRAEDVLKRSEAPPPRHRLAACVAQFAEILRGSPYADVRSVEQVELVLAQVCAELPLDNRAAELLGLVRAAKTMLLGR